MSIQMVSGASAALAKGSDASRTTPAATPGTVEARAPAVNPEASVPAPDGDQVREATQRINEQLRALQQDIHFSVDEETGHTIVRVLDGATGQTIRQIPSEEALAISQSLERLQGVLLKQQA